MKYEVKFTSQFKRDLKLAKKQKKDIDVLPCRHAFRTVLGRDQNSRIGLYLFCTVVLKCIR